MKLLALYPAGIFLLLCSACKNDLEEVERMVSAEELMVETMREVEVLYSDSAVVRVRITGPVLKRRMERQHAVEEFTEGVEVEFYDPRGRRQSLLTANYGIRREDEGSVTVRGDVVWRSETGDMLETEELSWDQDRERIYSNEFVTITRPEEVIYGYGFETDQDFSHWRIRSPEGRIRLEELKD